MEKKKKVKYGNSSYDSSRGRYVTFKRPDDRFYKLSVPISACQKSTYGEDGYCIVHGSREFEGWVKETCNILTKKYYRDKTIDEVSNIKRYRQVDCGGFLFAYDYFDGVVEIYNTGFGHYGVGYGFHNTIHKTFKLKKKLKKEIKEKIETGLSTKFDRKFKVNKIKFVDIRDSHNIKVKLWNDNIDTIKGLNQNKDE